MGDCPLADIGDDFHVCMWMRREAGLSGDLVVVPDPGVAPVFPLKIVVVSEGEMVLRLEPAVIGSTQFRKWPAFNHDGNPCAVRGDKPRKAKMTVDKAGENRKDGMLSFRFWRLCDVAS